MTRPLLLLGLLLGAQCALALPTEDIIDEYGVCPQYKVVEGDTLFEIAKKLKVDQAALSAATQACGVDINLLQIGSSICLPGYDTELCMDIVRTDPDRPYCQVYVVQPGDTLSSVAAKFNFTDQELIDLNSDYLDDGYALPHAGQYIRTPGWNQDKCRDFNDNDRPMCQMYTVQAGDTAIEIAQKYKVDVTEMLDLNSLTAADTIPVGSFLKLPKWNESCPEEGIPAVLPSDTVNCRVTVLGQSESLALLAERYLTTLNAIYAVNPKLKNANATLLQPGIYVNLPPFGPDCVGNANLVDIPTSGDTALPADYDYNGVTGPAPSPAGTPTVAPTEAPAAGPTPSEAPAAAPVSSPPAAPAPTPTPAPPTGGASAAGASLVAAALALLAGALAL
ncbi:hypothetical protein ABPG75_001439 [Micractinium tetrahymenae]